MSRTPQPNPEDEICGRSETGVTYGGCGESLAGVDDTVWTVRPIHPGVREKQEIVSFHAECYVKAWTDDPSGNRAPPIPR